MIDEVYREKTSKKSVISSNIDNAYLYYINQLNSELFTLPYSNTTELDCKVNFNVKYVLVEGFRGKLIINKLSYNKELYTINEPLICEEYIIYGKFNFNGDFIEFNAKPLFGLHQHDTGDICVGVLQYDYKALCKDINMLRITSELIFDMLSTVNMNSMLESRFPEQYIDIGKMIKVKNIEYMLENNLIKPFWENKDECK